MEGESQIFPFSTHVWLAILVGYWSSDHSMHLANVSEYDSSNGLQNKILNNPSTLLISEAVPTFYVY